MRLRRSTRVRHRERCQWCDRLVAVVPRELEKVKQIQRQPARVRRPEERSCPRLSLHSTVGAADGRAQRLPDVRT